MDEEKKVYGCWIFWQQIHLLKKADFYKIYVHDFRFTNKSHNKSNYLLHHLHITMHHFRLTTISSGPWSTSSMSSLPLQPIPSLVCCRYEWNFDPWWKWLRNTSKHRWLTILPGWLSGSNVQWEKEVCVEIHIACCICWFMLLMNHQFLNDFR